jgi:hypothetical protein
VPRLASTLLAALALVLIPASPANASCRYYRVVTLGPGAVGAFGDLSLNERGHVAATGYDSSFTTFPFLWKLGAITPLPPLPQLGGWDPWDINDSDEITGSTNGGDPVVWKDGTLHLLPRPNGDQVDPSTVNGAGEIYGEEDLPEGSRIVSRAVTFRDGRWRPLPMPSWVIGARPYDSPEQGVVVGFLWSATDVFAFRWDHGSLTTYPTPLAYTSIAAFDGNRLGQMVGYVQREDANANPFGRAAVFADSRTTLLPTLGGVWAVGTAINDHGTAVGWALDANGGQHGVVWHGRRIRNLDRELPRRLGYFGMLPRDINDRGTIVADVSTLQSGGRLILLRRRRHPLCT